jgi:hypothetical protein
VHVQQANGGNAHDSERLWGVARADLGGVFAGRLRPASYHGANAADFRCANVSAPAAGPQPSGCRPADCYEVAPFMARRPRGVAGPTHPGLDRQHQPDFQPEQVVEASLDGLRRGELVCCPSLHDDALLREFDHVKDAIFNHANTTRTPPGRLPCAIAVQQAVSTPVRSHAQPVLDAPAAGR